MAARNSTGAKRATGQLTRREEQYASPDRIDPGSVLALPFVADVPDESRPGRTTRKFWVVTSIDDYGEACRIGAGWAAEYVAWEAAFGMSFLFSITEAMAESHSRRAERGFAVGFLDALRELAIVGASAYGGAHRYGELKDREYRERRAQSKERERAEIAERVSRMNTGRRAKRAQLDPRYRQFRATLIGSSPS